MNFSLKKVLGSGLFLGMATMAASALPAANIGSLPLWFEARQGTATGQFTAHGRDATFSVSADGAGFMLRQTDGTTAEVKIQFIGGQAAAKVTGESELAGKVNYLIGNNLTDWKSGIATFGQVRLENIYPGVDAVFYGNQQKLEYDLNLAAGVNPATIGIRYQGAEKLSVDPQGDLVIGLPGGEVIQHQPLAYQIDAKGMRHEINAKYKILAGKTVQFAVGAYDHSEALVIDPILGYSTFFGGNKAEIGWAIALDGNTNIYIAGRTFSTLVSNGIPFATTLFTNYGGGKLAGDAFVAEFDNSGQTLKYCTYLGGSDDDSAYGLAVNSAGEAYVAGATRSTNFPVKNAIVNGSYNGSNISGVFVQDLNGFTVDAFVAKLSVDGTSLVYSTLLGGNSSDEAFGIALDPAGDAYVTGFTYSTNFPVTPDAYQSTLQCTNSFDVNANSFVSEIAPGGNALNYSTYLGGTNFDLGRSIAYSNGFVYVAGYTASTNFPWVNGLSGNQILNNFTNATRTDHAEDAFVTVFTNSTGGGLGLLYSTFLGSTNEDVATGIVGDGQGGAYVVGWTTSTNFPTTNGVPNVSSFVQTNLSGTVAATNSFLTRTFWNGTNCGISFSQMFGGRGIDQANGVALDGAGNIFVVGSASSISNYPTTGNLFGDLRRTNFSRLSSPNIRPDVVVTVFKSDFSQLLYSCYMGGSSYDFGNAIAVDAEGTAYITGQTLSTNFPAIGLPGSNGFRSVRDGTNDAFLAIIPLSIVLPDLLAGRAGTNAQVAWVPAGPSTTPATLPVESVTNLLSLSIFVTNAVVVTNRVSPLTLKTNFIVSTNLGFADNWKIVPQGAVLTTNSTYPNGAYIYTFDPTNRMQFFRFHHN
jgi:hypothetical protein